MRYGDLGSCFAMAASLVGGIAAVPVHAQPALEKKIVFNICNYCIQAKDLVLPLANGGTRPVSWTSFVRESKVTGRQVAGWGGRPNGYVVIAGGTMTSVQGIVQTIPAISDAFVIEPDFDLKMLVFQSDPSAEVAIPQIRSRDGERYSKSIRTDSVCIGSQFKAPTHYFVAPDNQPMATIPYLSQRVVIGGNPVPLNQVVSMS